MQTRLSNEIKVLIYVGDMDEEIGCLRKEDCNNVLQYSYDSVRGRDQKGFPTGDSSSLILKLKIRNFTHTLSRHFLIAIGKNRPYDYNFLFNATFDDNKVLKGYDNKMQARGYVVDIEETFDNYQSEGGADGQKIMTVELLLSRLTFTGENNNSVLTISND